MSPTRPKRPLTTLGTTTFATAIPAPASNVPANSAVTDESARTSRPATSGRRARKRTRSAPSRLASTGASGASSPKQRIGALVRRPAAAAERSRSSVTSSITGGTLATAIRRLRPASTMPAARSGGPPEDGLSVLEADVVLGERGRRLVRGADVSQLGELKFEVEGVASLGRVQHRRHPPREVFGTPDAAQRVFGVTIEQCLVAGAVPGGDCLGEQPHVGDSQVEPLRARRRHDVRGVPREQQTAAPHRLDNEAPHARDAFLEDLARVQRPTLDPESPFELLPDPLVWPLLDFFVGPDLEIESRHRRRAHAVEGEAPLVVRVDQLLVRRRRGGEDPEPGERILTLERRQNACRNAVPAHAVEAVASGDEVAGDLPVVAVVPVMEDGPISPEALGADVLDVEEECAARVQPGGDQILHDLLLPVDHDSAAAGQRREVDPVPLAGELQLDPVVDETLPSEPLSHADLLQQVDSALLEHPGPDAALDVLAGSVLENDGVDPLQVEEVSEDEAGRPGADDADLRPLGPQPQTSCAVSTIRRSLATCSSCVSALPSTVEEKPHCGERQSCSSGTNSDASSRRRFSSSFSSSSPRFVVTSPRTTIFPSGTNRKGSNVPERSSSYSRKNPSTCSSLKRASATKS